MIDECIVCNSKNKKWQLLLSNSPDWNWTINNATKDRGDKLNVVVGDYIQIIFKKISTYGKLRNYRRSKPMLGS